MSKCVLKSWTWDLPLMQQTVLLTAVRGPDGCTKTNDAKHMVKLLRTIILNNADEKSDFMEINVENFTYYADKFVKEWDIYPFHFVMHLLHAAEIVGYRYPGKESYIWREFYFNMCSAMHLNPESPEQLDSRLSK
jgi:hypothetical protein